MRFVYDHSIEVRPVEVGEVYPAGHSPIPREVGVRQQGVAETVFGEGVVGVVVRRLIQRPVSFEFLRAEYEDALVARFAVFDHGERGISLAQAHAVGEYAAVVPPQLGYDALHAVFLEVVQRAPYLAVGETGGFEIGVSAVERVHVFPKQLEQRLVVNRFGGVVHAEPRERVHEFAFGVFGEFVVRPQVIEPRAQLGEVGGVFHRQIYLDIRGRAAAKPAPGEVGAADHADTGRIERAGEIHFAVQEVRLADGAYLHALAFRPRLASLGKRLLRQRERRRKPVLAVFERLGFEIARVERGHRRRIPEQKPRSRDGVHLARQHLVAVDAEVGGHQIEGVRALQPAPQIAGDVGGLVVQYMAGGGRFGVCLRHGVGATSRVGYVRIVRRSGAGRQWYS